MGRRLNKENFETIRTALLSVEPDTKDAVEKVAKVTGWAVRTVYRVQRSMTFQGYKLMLAGELYDRQEAQRSQRSVVEQEPPLLSMQPLTPIMPPAGPSLDQSQKSKIAVGVLIVALAAIAIAIGIVIGYAL